jgi:hypothetical protein
VPRHRMRAAVAAIALPLVTLLPVACDTSREDAELSVLRPKEPAEVNLDIGELPRGPLPKIP